MTFAWIDASNGAAGDMLLAALLDAGADEITVRDGLARLDTERIDLHLEEVRRHGLRALQVQVRTTQSVQHRRLAEIAEIICAAGLADPVVQFATATFARLAAAEGSVHGIAATEVHFHEVGALDAIADVVGCALALNSLDLLAADVVVSPVAVGSGSVHTAHGLLPVPAPAVLRLLADRAMPVAGHAAGFELCTPTGAALLASVATEFGGIPPGVPKRIGVGAGAADPAGHANVLRIVLAERPASAERSLGGGDMLVVEATVDDLDPRVWPEVLRVMRATGAADAWCTPVLMRNGRPGHVLTVLVAPAYVDLVNDAVFRHTSTLGLRVHPVQRLILPRDRVEVPYGDVVVGVKRGLLGGEVITTEPEYEEARQAAEQTGQPLRAVLAQVREAARNARPGELPC